MSYYLIFVKVAIKQDNSYTMQQFLKRKLTIPFQRQHQTQMIQGDGIYLGTTNHTDANGAAPQCGINIEPNRDDSGSIPADAICKDITISNTTINVWGKGDYWGQFFCFMTMNYPDNSIITAENIRIANCTFNGDCGNYSGANVSISDTLIGDTFYDEQNTELNNVSYEDIWRG